MFSSCMYTYMVFELLFGRLFVRFSSVFVFCFFLVLVEWLIGTRHADGLSCSNSIPRISRVKHCHSYTFAHTRTPIMHNLCKYKKNNFFILKKKESLILFSLCSGRVGWRARIIIWGFLLRWITFFSLNYK